MTIAVLLQTCGREDLTRRTVESFAECNYTSRMVLLHADDEAVRDENIAIAKAAGFKTVFAPCQRRGQMAGLKAMCAALPEGVEWIAYLENDWETVRTWPLDWLGAGTESLRLFGHRKAHEGPRALAGRMCLSSGEPIVWDYCYGYSLEQFESAEAHFVAPSITRADVLLPLVRSCATVKDICRARPLRSVRPVENVVWHIGAHEGGQTPGFMA